MSPDPDTSILGDGSLLLRPYRAGDAAALHAAVSESVATVGRWLPWCHAGYELDDSCRWIEQCAANWSDGSRFAFAVLDAEMFVGAVGVSRIDAAHRSGNLGYWIRQSRHGRGLAWRAARLAAVFAFAQLDLVRLDIVAEMDNRASRRTAEKVGARFEGMARNRLIRGGEAVPGAVYGLIPADLQRLADA